MGLKVEFDTKGKGRTLTPEQFEFSTSEWSKIFIEICILLSDEGLEVGCNVFDSMGQADTYTNKV